MDDSFRKKLTESIERSERESSDFWHEQEAYRRESDMHKEKIKDFTRGVGLVSASMEAYALWLAAYLAADERRRITHTYGYSLGRSLKTPTAQPRMENGQMKMYRAPVGYGAYTVNMLLLTDISPQVVYKDASGKWLDTGHGMIFTLRYDSGEWVADTNSKYVIPTYADVSRFMLEHGSLEAISRYLTS